MKIIAIIFFIFIFLHGKTSGGGGEIPPNFQTEQSTETNDGQHQTGQYFAKINGQSYEIETPDIRVEVQMVKKHPLIIDSEREEHLLINDEDRGVLPPGNHLDIEAPGCIINGNIGNRLLTSKSGGTSCRPKVSDKPLPIMEAGDVDIIRQQHIRYYADIDGRKYPTEGPDYDVLLYGTDLLVDGKLYKNAVPTGYINYINRIEERIPVLGSSGRSIQLSAAGNVQGNNARLHTNVVGHQISGSVSLPEIPIGGNSDYINTGHNKHDGKPTFGDTKREEKQKNKQKQQKRGELIGGNFTHINNQNNENIGGTQDIGRIQIEGMPPGGALHLNTGGNRNVGGTQMIGGIKIGKMPTGGTFGLNIGGNRNVGGTQTIGGIQIGRMPTGGTFGLNIGGNRNVGGTQNIGGIKIGDMAAGTTTEDNHNLDSAHEIGDLVASLRNQLRKNKISINGQNYAVDGPNVNVGVEGHDLSVNGTVYQNRATEKHLQIIQDKNIRNVIVSVPLAFFSTENITVGQINAECDGNLYIGQSTGGCLRILCVDIKKRAYTNGPKTRGNLQIKNTTIECVSIGGEDENVIESDGVLQITESPMGNVAMKSGGNLKIKNSKMEERVHFESGGALQIDNIVKLPMGSFCLRSDGAISIDNSKIESYAQMYSGGSFTITNSVIVNDAEMHSGGHFTITNSEIEKNAVMTSGGSFTIMCSEIKNGKFECNGSMTIKESKMESGSIVYSGSFTDWNSQIASNVVFVKRKSIGK